MSGSERLREIALVGTGARAHVYRGELQGERGTRRAIAIKRLRDELKTDHAAVELFVNEARVTVRLAHPNVVHGLELGKDDRGYYLVCEWLDGATLADVVAHGGPLAPPAWLALAEGLLSGLGYVHALTDDDGKSLELLHRDVSPSNVFITRGGVTKLCDFGVACCRDSATTLEATRVGTEGFAAPEQDRGEATRASDVYAVARTLMAAAGEASELTRPLERALEQEPSKRPADAHQLWRELSDGARARGLEAEPRALAERVGSLPKRDTQARPLDHAVMALLGDTTGEAATPASGVRAAAPRESRRQTRLAVLVGLGLVVLAVLGAWLARGPEPASIEGPVAAPVRVAPALPPAPAVESPPEAVVPPTTTVASTEVPPGPVVPVRAVALVSLNAVPWARVRVDGAMVGNTPLRELPLRVGKHQVVLEHPPQGRSHVFSIEVTRAHRQDFVFDLQKGTFERRVIAAEPPR